MHRARVPQREILRLGSRRPYPPTMLRPKLASFCTIALRPRPLPYERRLALFRTIGPGKLGSFCTIDLGRGPQACRRAHFRTSGQICPYLARSPSPAHRATPGIGFVLHDLLRPIGFVLHDLPAGAEAAGRRGASSGRSVLNPQSAIRNREIGFVLHVSLRWGTPAPVRAGGNWVRFARLACRGRRRQAAGHVSHHKSAPNPQSAIDNPQSKNWLRFAR